MMNILQIDVEDWYQSKYALNWELYGDRVVECTKKILAILKSNNTRATFFVLGHVAEKFPQLVEMIKSENHEVASHGYSHIPITEQTGVNP